jgi:beta-glucosidase
LHNGKQLIEEISNSNNNIIVIINSPGPINMDWKDKVKGIIFAGLAGPESGNGIADVLFGDVNPSGHLPFVMGKREQYPADIKDIQEYDSMINSSGELEFKDTVEYNEGLFIGQYWFDKKNELPLYHFGHGLSYTKFEFSDLKCNFDKKLNRLEARFKIKNIGNYDGGVVAFLYLTFPLEDDNYPIRVLKGFDKYFIKINETQECCITVDEHDLSYYDINSNDYIMPQKGSYIIYVGQSSNITDLTLTDKVTI